MGTKGALFPGKGGGGKGPGSGSSSSGGGPPANIPGGSKGNKTGKKGKGGTEGDGYHSGDGPLGRWLFIKASESGKGYVEEPDGKGVWVQDENGDWWYQEVDEEPAPAETPKEGDPIDGDFGMPYTGSGGGGEKPDPNEPVGGLDREAGKVFPVIPKGGSSGDTGGKTPGDKDGEDDSGKFLGDPNLTGGPDRGDPDAPDYYTPNVLDEISKNQKDSK